MSVDAASSNVAWRVGRYDIVGHLATGGMAEILLARILGPSGFQRPLVIKRILPHLAKQKEFRQMFLDEARIVAGIRHPNVVQVQELGTDGDELFLAMEYIEGESTSGLMRRLHARGERLDRALAAYIVAEACAGLHAAHELTDAEGKKLEIVHRDASPHNLFISYEGAVTVLDFGIATAADRVARTEAGQFKGKFEYASPEQCKGATLDRRSDIFALGTVLWELTTGRRLFKRPTGLEMLKAICELPIPHPTSVDPDYPEELARVTMRALSRRRRERYQTALEMRHDLLAVVRQLSTSLTPDEDLGRVMRRLFQDRREEKLEMLRRVQAGTTVAQIPVNDADAEVEIPVAVTVEYSSVPPGEGTDTGSDYALPTAARAPSDPELLSLSGVTPALVPPSPSPVAAAPSGSHRTLLLLGAVGAVLTVLALVTLVALRGRGRETAPTAATASASAPPPASAPPTTSVSSAAASASAPASSSAAAPAPPAEVVVQLETIPKKAQVFLDGVKKGTTPLDLHIAHGERAVVLELRHPGYATHKERIVPDANQKLRLTLVPLTTGPGPAGTKDPYHRFD